MTEYAHNLAGTILKAYDDYDFHHNHYFSANGTYQDYGAYKALDTVIIHATGKSAELWARSELEEFLLINS